MISFLQPKFTARFLIVSFLSLFLFSGNRSYGQTISTYASSNTFGLGSVFLDVHADGLGNVYIGDSQHNRVLKVNSSGTMSVFATGVTGNSDGLFVATDPSGNVYISSYDDGKIYKYNSSGTQLAAWTFSGTFGIAYDPILNLLDVDDWDSNTLYRVNPTTGAQSGFLSAAIPTSNYNPWGIAVDASSNIYVANGGSIGGGNFIYKINSNLLSQGTAYVGFGSYGNAGDGNNKTSANLKNPTGIAVDAAGNLYIGDQSNNVIRKVDASTNIITTFAGINDGGSGSSGDGGLSTAARLLAPFNVSYDPSNGNVYIADEGNTRIRVVCSNPTTPISPSGVTTRCQGGGTGVYTTSASNASSYNWTVSGSGNTVSGTGTSATVTWSSSFTGTATVSVTASNSCGTSPAGSASVTVNATPTGGVINTYAGSNGFGLGSTFLDVHADGLGNVYIGDSRNNRVLKVNSSGTMSVFATSVTGVSDGLFIATDPSGNVYVSSYDDSKIYKYNSSGTLLATWAFSGTFGIAYDPVLNLLDVDDWDSNTLFRLNPTTGAQSGFLSAAIPTANYNPWGIAVDASSNIYVADGGSIAGNNVIYKINSNLLSQGTAYVGSGSPGRTGDGGNRLSALLNNPTGISVDAAGNLYIGDQSNNVIRKVDASTNIITTFAGINDGGSGSSGDGGSPTVARLFAPFNVSYDPSNGNVYIGDEGNTRIRVVSPAPATPSIPSGTTSKCQGAGTDVYTTGAVTGATSYTWSVTGSGNTISGTGNSSTVSWNAGFTGTATVSVVANAVCPSAASSPASSVSVVVTPGGISTPSSPSGTTTRCQGSGSGVYTVPAVGGAVSYTWSVTGSGNTISGTGTSGTVTWSSAFSGTASVSVVANGGCSTSSPASLSVTVNATPTGSVINTYASSNTFGLGSAFLDVHADGLGNVYIGDSHNNRVLKVNSSGTMSVFATGVTGNGDGLYLATDPAGNVYVSSYDDNKIYKYNSSGTQLAAWTLNSVFGIAYDATTSTLYASIWDGVIDKVNPTTGAVTSFLTSSLMDYPWALAVDGSGNLYLANGSSFNDDYIYKITAAGAISVFAGLGNFGNAGDGNIATNSRLNPPTGVAVDPAGNVYIADQLNNVVRKVDASTGIIHTIAGINDGGGGTLSGDGGSPTAARLNQPYNVSYDPSNGNLYIGDGNNTRIRVLAVVPTTPSAPSGTMSRCQASGTDIYTTSAVTGATAYTWSVSGSGNTVSGTGTSATVTWSAGFSGTSTISVTANGSCPGASSSAPSTASVTVNPTSVATPSTPTGTTTRCMAGNTGTYTISAIPGAISYTWSITGLGNSVSGTGTSATVTWGSFFAGTASVSVTATNGCGTSSPAAVTVTTNPTPSVITTFPGTLPTSGTFGTSTYYGTAIDNSGNLYVADWSNWRIIKVTPAGVVTTFASNGADPRINGPVGIVFDGSNNLYVAEGNLDHITKITTAGVISDFITLPGNPGFDCAEGIAIDPTATNLYVSMYCKHVIYKINISTKVATTIAGTYGSSGNTGDGAIATSATIGTASDGLEEIAVDANNNVYISDPGNHRVRIVAGVSTTRFPVVGNIYNFAGSPSGSSGNSGDGGLATSALLNWPTGVRVDANGNVYISDVLNHNVRVVNPAGYISTFVNTASTSGNGGDGLIATSATLTGPYGLNFDPLGNLFIVDQGSSKVREVYAPLIPALNGTVTLRCQGAGTSTYTAVSTSATSYNWSVTGSGNSVAGTGSSATVTWASGFTGTATVSVTATNGCGNTPASAMPVVVSPALSTPSIPSGPNSRCIGAGTSVYTVAAVGGATSYSWSISGAGNTISGTGTSATVTWSAGYSGVSTVSVAGTNAACGTGPSSGLFVFVNPPLSGTYTVDNTVSGIANLFPNTSTFNSVASAIATLNNNCGILAPGVTFNVKAGMVETFASATAGWINLSSINTSATPIVFRKNGAGANPLLKVIGTAGGDAGIFLEGVSYVTIDGIDVFDNGTSFSNYVEYGIALCNLGTVHGCQHDTIRNCTITLNPNDAWANDPTYSNYINNTTLYTTIGIYQGMDNATFTGYGSFLPCSSTGSNSFNSYYSNTIAGAGMGLVLWGGTCAYDTNNDIGTLGGNTIGTSGSPIGLAEAEGVHAQNQTNFRVANNTIKLNATQVLNDANYDGVYGIYLNGGQSTQELDHNTITVSSNGFIDSPADPNCAGIGFAGTSSGTVNIHNNIISNAVVSYRNFSGIYDNGVSAPMNIYGNTITGATSPLTNSISLTGINLTSSVTGTTNVHDNYITSCSTPVIVTGINMAQASGTAAIYNNHINTLSGTGTVNGFAYGLNIAGGTALSVYNNFISNLTAAGNNTYGALVNTSTPCSLYYNTIYLNQTTGVGASFSSYGIYVFNNSAPKAVDLRNNLIVNNNTPGTSGKTIALQLNTLNAYASTSDYNSLYAGTPGTQHLIESFASGSDQTLAQFQTRVSPSDAHSITINPGFTSVTDLHKTNMTYPGYLYLIAGQPIAGYTTDIDGDTRDVTTPDMGADEFIACEPSRAGVIAGAASVCQNDNAVSYSVPSIAGATGYNWTIPNGASIEAGTNTNTISVFYSPSASSGTVTVNGTNGCGSGLSSSFAVTVKTTPPLVVTPNNAVCTGTTNATLVASGASTYTWSPVSNLTPSNGTAATETVQISQLTFYTVTGTGANSCTANVIVPVATVAIGGLISPSFSIICNGGTKALTVNGAAGNNYQWQISSDNSAWTNISGATSNIYTTASVDGTTNKFYRLLALSNSCWNVASTTAEVDISNPVIAVTATNITDNSFTLSWSPTGTGNYAISYSGTSSATQTSVTPDKTITGLTANGTYSITVTQTGVAGCSASGTLTGVNTLCAMPTGVTLSSPANAQILVSWTGVGGANYRVYYRPLFAFGYFFTKDVSGVSSALITKQGANNLYGSTTYEVYVSRLDCPTTGTVGQGTNPTNVTTLPTVSCPTPVIDSVRSLCPVQIEVFMHPGSSPTNTYNVYLQRITPTVLAVNSYGVSGNYFTINVPYSGDVYLIAVDSKCTGGALSRLYVYPGNVTVKPLCTSPANLVLSNPTCNGFTASWNSDQCLSNTASGYNFYMRQAGTINYNSYGVAPTANGIGPNKKVNWLASGRNFQVFVRSVYSCNGFITYGPSSLTQTIATLSGGCRNEEDVKPQDTKPAVQQYSPDNQEVFSLYPNPNTGEFAVDLSRYSTEDDAVRIEVISMLGQTVMTHLTTISGGHMSEYINLPNSTAAGTYIVRLTAGNNVYTTKINVSK